MSDDLLQLIFAAALILFGLLGGRKKKPTQQPPRRPAQPAQPARPAPPPTRTARPAPQMRSAPRPATPQSRDVLLGQLQRMLGGQGEAEPLEVEVPEAVSLEATDVDERRQRVEGTSARWDAGLQRGSESLETLEEAGESSHARFHARLQATAPAPPVATGQVDPATARLRQAIIWSEVLGPPVSMR